MTFEYDHGCKAMHPSQGRCGSNIKVQIPGAVTLAFDIGGEVISDILHDLAKAEGFACFKVSTSKIIASLCI